MLQGAPDDHIPMGLSSVRDRVNNLDERTQGGMRRMNR